MGFGLLQGMGQGWQDFAKMWGEIPEMQRARAEDARREAQSASLLKSQEVDRQATGLGMKHTQQQMDQSAKNFAEEERGRARVQLARDYWGRDLTPEEATKITAAHGPGAISTDPKTGVSRVSGRYLYTPEAYANLQKNETELTALKDQLARAIKYGDRQAEADIRAKLDSSAASRASAAESAAGTELRKVQTQSAKLLLDEATSPEARAASGEMKEEFDHFDAMAKKASDLETGTARMYQTPGGGFESITPGENSARAAEVMRNELRPLARYLADKWAKRTLAYYFAQQRPAPASYETLFYNKEQQLLSRVVGAGAFGTQTKAKNTFDLDDPPTTPAQATSALRTAVPLDLP